MPVMRMADPRSKPAPLHKGAETGAPRASLIDQHRRDARASVQRLLVTPIGSLLTVLVIGIALALPAGLQLLVENARALAGAWEGAVRLSVFMEVGAPPDAARGLADRLGRRSTIEEVRLITPDQALAEFEAVSGFGAALDLLGANPLPAVIVVRPKADLEPAALEALQAELAALESVDQVQLDAQWLRRLDAMLELVRRAVLLLAALFALAVGVVVANTVRLEIQNRRSEIEVVKLIGATDGFIRRPFLWEGLVLGAAGGLAAWVLLQLALWAMAGPVSTLAGLYGSEFTLLGPGLRGLGGLLGVGAAIGWLGSFAAVTRHLGEIEPR
jgi:cell division transport system permease protein